MPGKQWLALFVLFFVSPAAAQRAGPTAIEPLGEIAAAAASVADVTARRYPYDTTRRLIRGRIERGIREHDSEAFRLGAHLAAAFWISQLPVDLAWRDTALARHRDVVRWLVPRVGQPVEAIAHAVAQAERMPAASEQQLLGFLQATVR
jgi:hypothetical protein